MLETAHSIERRVFTKDDTPAHHIMYTVHHNGFAQDVVLFSNEPLARILGKVGVDTCLFRSRNRF